MCFVVGLLVDVIVADLKTKYLGSGKFLASSRSVDWREVNTM